MSYTFEKKSKADSQTSLPFNRKISISPSGYQLNLIEKTSDEQSYNNSSFEFDRSRYLNLESIFKNEQNNASRYKIRIRSKKSGKVVDINVNYVYEVVNNLNKNKK